MFIHCDKNSLVSHKGCGQRSDYVPKTIKINRLKTQYPITHIMYWSRWVLAPMLFLAKHHLISVSRCICRPSAGWQTANIPHFWTMNMWGSCWAQIAIPFTDHAEIWQFTVNQYRRQNEQTCRTTTCTRHRCCTVSKCESSPSISSVWKLLSRAVASTASSNFLSTMQQVSTSALLYICRNGSCNVTGIVHTIIQLFNRGSLQISTATEQYFTKS